MQPFQLFRQGDLVLSLAVRQDDDGPPYSQLSDIQETFPRATLFKLDEVILNFLEDENRKKYEPKRIAHFPDYIIDVVCAQPGHAPSSNASPLSSLSAQFSTEGIGRLVSQLYIQPSSFSSAKLKTLARSVTYSPGHLASSSLTLSNPSTYQATSITRPMVALSAIASDITHIQRQLDRSADQHSEDYQQLLKQLVQLLQDQAEAKERDKQVLAELEAARLRDEEMLRLQRQTIDRLIVAQQRIEAILVQNYELHEYPIPRLFVILPDSYERWDPRNLVAERFRLYFLCECGDHCNTPADSPASTGQLTIATVSPTATAAATTAISTPITYGPYVLGMLRILKHCLAVAAAVSPVVALADSSVKDVMDGVKSISESTMAAVDVSINYLEKNLNGDAVADEATRSSASMEEGGNEMFKDLAALNKDADKILGNLYRITTETGQVKWVCLNHYRQVYRETAMASFLHCVETNGGAYDPQLGKVAIALKSNSQQAQAVAAFKVTFNWSFGSSDLVKLVDKIALSNASDFELDLMDQTNNIPLGSLLRPGKGKYHSLLGLLSNINFKGQTFTSVDFIGPQTSGFPSSHPPIFLQSFRYLGAINIVDDTRLAEIILLCPHLADLRLGCREYISFPIPNVDRAIGTMSKLKTLHRYCLFNEAVTADEINEYTAPYGSTALTELVDHILPYPIGVHGLLQDAIQRSFATLEILFLQSNLPKQILQLTSLSDLISSHRMPFTRLTHLELIMNMTPATLNMLTLILPKLVLVHLSVGYSSCCLVAHVNLKFLRSLLLKDISQGTIDPRDFTRLWSGQHQIESLKVHKVWKGGEAIDVLTVYPLRRLYLLKMPIEDMRRTLKLMNVSRLQMLSIFTEEYDDSMEAILAARSAEFAEEFVLQLLYRYGENVREIHKANVRDVRDSSTRLSSRHVRVLDYETAEKEYYSSISPPSYR
ncbi:hypothetical protein BGW39_000413 [Mortierella sp. 14UC]|nr:hypothetical protein BGW39_000413 [Mortierella sp. 14UC]